MAIFKNWPQLIFAFVITNIAAVSISCSQSAKKENASSKEELSYDIEIDNLNSFIKCKVRTKMKNNFVVIQLKEPSSFAIDGKQLSYVDSRDETSYGTSFEPEEFSTGMHAFIFTDATGKKIIDSFWYCQPMLQESATAKVTDSILKIKISGFADGDSINCNLRKKNGEYNPVKNTNVIAREGYLIVPLTTLLIKHDYTETGNYTLSADYYYSRPLKIGNGKITVFGNCKKPVSLELK